MKTHASQGRAWFGLRLMPAVILALLAAVGAARLEAQPVPLQQDAPGAPFYLAGQVLVQFRETATDDELAGTTRRGVLTLLRHLRTGAMDLERRPGITLLWTGLPVAQAIAALQNDPAVEYAEPNWVYVHQATSDDPWYANGSLWGMYGDQSSPANAFGSQAAEAWAAGHTGSRNVVVGVIDEGIQVTHPDLAANLWTHPVDLPDGVDNDGNGYVDDVHGWNFAGNNNQVFTSGADSHGTHVAGTIGAVGGNGTGVAGVNWAVSIISGKFLGPNGGTTADAIEAVDYFTDLKVRHGLNLVALNNSWGGGGFSQGLLDAIVRAARQNILFVAAAGNGDFLGRAINTDATAYYPSCYNTLGRGTPTVTYDSVLSVTAINSTGGKASWANYGATTVDLGAPGVSVASTLPTDSYGSYSGTSMATPHVTGAIALYASTHPGASASEIRNAILGAAVPTPSLAGITVTGGRLDLSAVVAPPPAGPPAAPSGLTATAASPTQINLAWTDGSSNETQFRIERAEGGAAFQPLATIAANVRTYSDTGVSPERTYSYRVYAVNTSGSSGFSNTASATTPGVPAAPSGLTATARTRSRIDLAWTDNSTSEAGFRIERSFDNINFTQIATVGANVTSYASTGLSRNTTYFYRVRAYLGTANSDYSNVASALTLRK